MTTSVQNARLVSALRIPSRWNRIFSGLALKRSGGYLLPTLGSLALCVFGLLKSPALAQENRATFPAFFDQMVIYGDYRRGSGGELAYALPETIAIAKSGQTLPPGTVLVLEIYGDGALTSYFVMEKGEGWGLDFAEEDRAGDWHFQQFGTDRSVQREAIADRCVSCHQGAEETDFMFTLGRMQDYLP
jgi:hypothetical protein